MDDRLRLKPWFDFLVINSVIILIIHPLCVKLCIPVNLFLLSIILFVCTVKTTCPCHLPLRFPSLHVAPGYGGGRGGGGLGWILTICQWSRDQWNQRGGEREGGRKGVRGVSEWCKAKYVAHCDQSLAQYAPVLFTN